MAKCACGGIFGWNEKEKDWECLRCGASDPANVRPVDSAQKAKWEANQFIAYAKSKLTPEDLATIEKTKMRLRAERRRSPSWHPPKRVSVGG